MFLSYVVKCAVFSAITYWVAGYWSWWWPVVYSWFALTYQMGVAKGRAQYILELDRITHELSDLRMRLWKTEQERDEAREKIPKPILVPRRGPGWGIN